ncbi:MAG: hypothetical protein K1X79_11110 [Oligoflexia bacterium]|nr:hypothetical protein [Oligoflexia bacterium]
MRGFLFLGLLLGLLYYAFLSKESAQENTQLLSSVREQVSDIAERENERFLAAKSCGSGDDEEASDCLQRSYQAGSHRQDQDSSRTHNSYQSSRSARSNTGTSALRHLPLRSGTSDVPSF